LNEPPQIGDLERAFHSVLPPDGGSTSPFFAAGF
jgi:hypothetical protein